MKFDFTMIWNNILVLVDIARCQCVSTDTCKRAFSVHNVIKTKFRNRYNPKYLDSVLNVAIEGICTDFNRILVVAIELWQILSKWGYLYSRLEKYLSSQPYMEDGHDTMVS